ncbi:MAG: NYN domain-containing protein [Chloroflexi bacterium]|nr:NYN domain-containing protein [Chloroflexota bacterium]
MKANVYIDGFNLYYGCLKGTPYKWLDVSMLAQALLPTDTIHHIKYFTAKVSARPNDPDQPMRQQTYLRALETLPNLEIVFGRFQTRDVYMPLVNPVGQQNRAYVTRTDEKGSDVNLALHMLHDGHRGDYELAVIVSNDADLVEAIRLVRRDLHLPVGVLNPQIKAPRPSVDLRREATFIKSITKQHLKASQFPLTLTDASGVITKPTSW